MCRWIRLLTLILAIFVVPTVAWSAGGTEFSDAEAEHHFMPEDGMVPDEATAIKIAEAVWLPIYGKTLDDERPFHATLQNGVWFVTGTLPEGWLGGTAEAEISKIDGRILRISHGQ